MGGVNSSISYVRDGVKTKFEAKKGTEIGFIDCPKGGEMPYDIKAGAKSNNKPRYMPAAVHKFVSTVRGADGDRNDLDMGDLNALKGLNDKELLKYFKKNMKGVAEIQNVEIDNNRIQIYTKNLNGKGGQSIWVDVK